MSLIDAFTEDFVMLIPSTESDGEGGMTTVWTEGDAISAALTLDSSTAAKVAESEGVTDLYTITTTKDITLLFHDVLRRVSDGSVFRVTSDGTDKKTPGPAMLDMRQVSAEKWRLTNDE